MQAGGSGPDPAVMGAIERGNAVVFLDVALGEGDNASNLGRIKLELFMKDVSKKCWITVLYQNWIYSSLIQTNIPVLFSNSKPQCPKTATNFKDYCTGERLQNEQPVGYKDCTFHRVIKGFMVQVRSHYSTSNCKILRLLIMYTWTDVTVCMYFANICFSGCPRCFHREEIL